MVSNKILTGLVALGLTAIPISAQAGSSHGHSTSYGHGSSYGHSSSMHTSHASTSSSCDVNGGSTCAPGPATEETVPEYYDVPSKTQHIYYDRPSVEPVVTKIVHHVPTAVYGRTHVTETIHAGQWTGPSLGCCNRQSVTVHRPQVQIVRPAPVRVVHPVIVRPQPVPVPVPVSPCRSNPYPVCY